MQQGRRIFVQCVTLAWMTLHAASPLQAAPPVLGTASASLTPDLVIVSTGDPITAKLAINVTGFVLAPNIQYVYSLPPNGRYIPNSVTLNGAPLADTDSRVTVFADSVRVTVTSSLPLANTSIQLRIRATGSIGQPVHHAGVVRGLTTKKLPLRGTPTWIEDETAIAIVPPLVMDTYIRSKNGTDNFNYGGASSLDIETGDSRRGLVQFNFSGLQIPGGYEVVAARLELFPAVPAGAAVTLRAHRLKQSWTEGTQDGTVCVGGATWQTRDCVRGWTTDGGDYDAAVAGSTTLDAATSFAAVEIPQLVTDWLEGRKQNQGLLLRATSATSDRSVLIASREGQSGFDRPVRLVVILAPRDAYLARAVTSAQAEILPHDVLTNLPSQRFVYTVKPSFDNASTGMNRFTITVPPGFIPVRVDSVRAATATLVENTDPTLTSGEYEVWGLGNTIDVRFAPPVARFQADPRIELVFHAGTPAVPNPSGADFPAAVDHDRRGFAAQTASPGNANGVPGDGDSWTVRAVDATVTDVVVSPSDTTIALGRSVSYRAVATYSNGDAVNVAPFAAWTITPAALASSGAQPHVITGDSIGVGAVRATFAGITSVPVGLEVTPPALVGIRVLPAHASFPAGATQPFEAWGIYENGDSLQITATAVWSSSDSTLAAIVSPGLVRGIRNGTATIVATQAGIQSAGAIADVTPAELVSLLVTPTDTTVALGLGAQMHARGTYTDSSTVDLTSVVTWNPTPTGIIDIDADGFARSTAIGTATVTATLGSVTSNAATFRVGPPVLASIAVTPPSSTIAIGDGVQLHAVGTLTNGQTNDITDSVTWNATPAGIVTITSTGMAIGTGLGTATVTAERDGITSNGVSITVTPPVVALVDSVRVTPAPVVLPPGASLQLTATVYYDDGSSADRTASALWASDAPAVASVDASGLLQTWSNGVALVRATFSGVVSLPCSVTVDTAGPDSLDIAPADTVAVLGTSLTYRATAHEGASTYDVTGIAAWSSTDTLVAETRTGGTVETRGVGVTTITAQVGATVSNGARLQVDPAAANSVVVLPTSTSLRLGRTKQMIAQAQYTNGSIVDVTSQSTWTSDAPTILYVDASGLATALALGTAHVRATYAGLQSAPSTVAVLPAVQVEALPAGDRIVPPGTRDALLMTVRCSNRYLDVRRLTALRTQISGPLASVHLRLDDGDGVFEPASDPEIGSGTPSGGAWTATGLSVALAVGASQTLYVTGDVSLTAAVHGSSADAEIAGIADLFWETATAVVADFPLQSSGTVGIRDLVRAQLDFVPIAADTIVAGTTGHALLELRLPSDGGSADYLNAIGIRQLGTARPGLEIDRLVLQRGPAPWSDVSQLVHTGGGVWAASDLHLDVPPAGRWVRIVADAALSSEAGRTLRFELPLGRLAFDSGRVGPVDSIWTNPNPLTLESPPHLVRAANFCRGGRHRAAFGGRAAGSRARADGLRRRCGHAGRVASAQREHWTERCGARSERRDRRRCLVGGPGQRWCGERRRRAARNDRTGERRRAVVRRRWPAAPGVERCAATAARDADTGFELGARCRTAGGALERGGRRGHCRTSDIAAPERSPNHRSASHRWPIGVGLRPAAGGEPNPHAGQQRGVGLRPARPRERSGRRCLESGSDRERRHRDRSRPERDRVAARRWRRCARGRRPANRRLRFAGRSGLGDAVDRLAARRRCSAALLRHDSARAQRREWPDVSGSPAAGRHHGRERQRRADRYGARWRRTAGHRGVEPGHLRRRRRRRHAVRPDARAQVALNLEILNTYAETRTLVGLEVTQRGSAADAEFENWSLHADVDQNGRIDTTDPTLAIASVVAGHVRFEAFGFDLQSLQQERLLVAYDLAPGRARDGSNIDCVITDAAAFEYAASPQGATSTAAEFEIDSTGFDSIDGMVASQIGNREVVPQTLGGGEANVVTLDLVLPSNGLDADVLQALAVELVPAPAGAEFGPDIAVMRLWQEQDDDPARSFLRPRSRCAAADVVRRCTAALRGTGGTVAPRWKTFLRHRGHRRQSDRCPHAAAALAAGCRRGRVRQRWPDRCPGGGPGDPSHLDQRLARDDLGPAAAGQPRGERRGAVGGTQSRQRPAAEHRAARARDDAADRVPIGKWSTAADARLGAGAIDTLAYRLHFEAAGTTQLTATVGTADSNVVAPPATSSNIDIQEPPSGVVLTMVSSMPALVNRGQSDVVPLVWKLKHPDPDPAAAAIAIRRLTVRDGRSSRQCPARSRGSRVLRGAERHDDPRWLAESAARRRCRHRSRAADPVAAGR
jgi:hypothetical protein